MSNGDLWAKGKGDIPKILVLDDEVCVTELLSEILIMLGYQPCCCNDPHQALVRLRSERFDLILSDFRMPGLDGRQFYHAVAAEHPGMEDRIVFLTGDTGHRDTLAFLKSVGGAMLPKPFRFGSVSTLVAETLARHRGQPVPAVAAVLA